MLLKNVPADHLPGGFGDFRIREDLVESYKRVLAQARALGGVVSSSGALRDLREPATAGRSRTSLHYTGRAIDLYIESGMRTVRNPYAVVPTVTESRVTWTIWCESVTPHPDDALFDATLVSDRELDCAIWKSGPGFTLVKRRGRFFSLTDLFQANGWQSIPARTDWKTSYLSCEWWHFQNQRGLKNGVTKFGDELRQVWPSPLVAASGLALNAVWSGQSFKAAAAGADAAPAESLGDEKVAWIQAVLNSTNGTTLVVDGRTGTATSTALRRFQSACGMAATGICDSATETALIQRALERLGNTPFANVGVRDHATTESLKAFQASAGLDADGIIGPRSRAAMVERLGRQTTPKTTMRPRIRRRSTTQR